MRSMNVWAWAPTGTGATVRRDRPAGRRRAGRVAGAAIGALLASALVPGVLAPASAEVDWIGPVAANGFPAFYDDGNVKLKLCRDGLAAGCLAGPTDVEAFWFSATATNSAAGGNLIAYEASLGGTYENGLVVLPGDEVGFNRLRFKLDNLVAGATYTITHPYGVNTLVADPRGRVDTTIEGVCAPEPGFTCDWNAVGRGFLGDYKLGTMTTFVKQVDAPAGRLGDINSPSALTGAPSGTNAVIVTGPNAGGVGVNTLTVTDFAVQGVSTLAAAGTPTMPDLVAASDTGGSNSDNITNSTLPVFAGTIDGFAGNEVGVELLVDGVPNGTTTTVGGAYSLTPATPLAQGPHRVDARSGNLVSTTRPFTVDTTAPLVTLGTTPSNNTTDSTPTFAFSSDDPGATFECQLLPSVPTFAPCTSPKTFAAQPDGDYTFNVRAIDLAGNVSSPPPFSWRIGAAVTRLSDFNRDGRTDLVARDGLGQLWLYPGNGTGRFLARQWMAGGWDAFTAIITPGDVTGDGNGDVLARTAAGALRLYPGDGEGGLGDFRQIGASGWNAMTAITAAALMSGDTRPDILARDSAGRLWLYPMVGNGTFQTRRLIGASGWNAMTAIMGPGDFSGDAKADLLARDGTGKLWLYRGNGTGQFSTRTQVGTGWAGMTTLLTPGNWDRTGGNDLIARDSSGTLWLYPGNNAGKLTPRRQIGAGFRVYTIA